MKKKTALITGASAGIGAAFCEFLAARGYDLILCARRRERLEKLAADLEQQYSIEAVVLVKDLAKKEAPEEIFRDLSERGIQVDFLVNNAGYSMKSSFCESSREEVDDFFNVMSVSVTRLCHLALLGMKENGYGRIINVASIAAFAPESPGSLYTPVKRYMLSLSKALSLEVSELDIQVTALCPGFTYTEFHDVLGNREKMNRLPKFLWMDSEPVVHAGYDAVMSGKAVCVPGLVNKLIALLCSFVPHSWLLALGPKVLVGKKQRKG
tara:strand:+ start:32 stop:832 length:801 start_codon:yes stop_codon:yes gene_type:complete